LHSFASRPLTGTALLAVAAAVLLLSASDALAEDTAPAFTSGPTIVGDAVVGSTLTAEATWTGEPAPQVKYVWRRCPATGGACQQIDGATTAQYLVTNADLGFRLGVRMQLKSKPFPDAVKADSLTTAVVVAAPTTPPPPPPSGEPPPPPPPTDPDPDPDPGQTPNPDPTPVPPVPRASFPEPVAPIVSAASRPSLLRPFPVVRIRGDFAPGGVRISLLSVNAPRSSRIAVKCTGAGCPLRSLSIPRAPARLRPFERFLTAGTVLQVRVTRPGRIGKYASFRIRAGSAPLRTDRCLMPGSTKPAACPAP
jgi:hypothetical protein